MFLKKFIGDRAFYKKVLAVSLPIMAQTGITNLVNLLDNIMVGRLGTEAMSGVSIVNQFVFIFNLLIFGAITAAGIFTAQYHGLGDEEGVRYTFSFKFLISVIATVLAMVAFALLDDQLVSLFLHTGSTEGDLALALAHGKQYLAIMLIGMIPYAVSQVYASTLRETAQPIMPMVSSFVAVGVNFVLNYILIFGKLGAPALGVRGAAIATVISRFSELLVLLLWGHLHPKKYPFLSGVYRSFRIPSALFFRIVIKGLPLMANEFFWAIAMTLRNQCYSTRGLDVVAAQNINSTIVNVFNVVYMAVGSSIGIIVGNLLGAGRLEEARDTDRKMMAFSIGCATCMGALLIASSHLFPQIYNTTDTVRVLAVFMILVSAAIMPFGAFAHSAYFTLRSGGRVAITLLFDSVFMWVVVLPVSFLFSYFTSINIHLLFIICQGVDTLKTLFGYILLRRGTWVRQLVADESLKG
ncbi:MAG: MATE family efflux transporter [Clostridia bacterium]|nr:MATE family efflux transporter [Clostridia bacterium]